MESVDLSLETFRDWLKPRPADCHKGDFGSVGILGGAPGMAGAPLLAARAALWLGTGRVYCGLLDERLAVDPVAAEVMLTTPEAVLSLAGPGCLVAGPGLGTSAGARGWLEAALAVDRPLLLDADALNLIATDQTLETAMRERRSPSLLTPHPGEAGRLLGIPAGDIQGLRKATTLQLAARFQVGVVLKGVNSLIHFPDRPLWRNPTGNPGMAAPGMGDVLAGMIASLAAQGLDLEHAALVGVYLHGAAGDALVRDGVGPNGLTAGEVARYARDLINRWIYGSLEAAT